jgi:FMN phosphatase YigB (HAD superfamily)
MVIPRLINLDVNMLFAKNSGREIDWAGIDYSYTIMNPLTLHHSIVIPEIYRRLGREHEASMRLQRWYKLRDSVGSPTDAPHQKARLVKEYYLEKLEREVFDNDRDAIELYYELEAKAKEPPTDLKEGLNHLRERGIECVVVSEVSSVQGVLNLIKFLRHHDLKDYFSEIITPAGRFTTFGELLDEHGFKGANKKSGEIYDRLLKYLWERRIPVTRAVIIGDDPEQDIKQAKIRGFKTIQYTGLIDRGRSGFEDYVINSWKKIKEIL